MGQELGPGPEFDPGLADRSSKPSEGGWRILILIERRPRAEHRRPRFEADRSTVVVRAGQVLGRFSAGSGQFFS